MTFKPCDILSFLCQDGSFGVAKLLRIDSADVLSTPESVYHFMIYKNRFPFPMNASMVSSLQPYIPHIAVLETSAKKSGCMFICCSGTIADEELSGYNAWVDAFFLGRSGVFDLPLDEASCILIEAFKASNQNSSDK